MSEDISPHVIRLKESESQWRKIGGPKLTAEEPFLTGLSEREAEELVRRNHALRRSNVKEARAFIWGGVPLPFDPEEYTVAELREELSEGEYSDAELEALAEAEAECQDRDTAIAEIESVRGGAD